MCEVWDVGAAGSCAEFLVHGVDVEGMQLGVDEELVHLLGQASPIPVTYAGGVRSLVRHPASPLPLSALLDVSPSQYCEGFMRTFCKSLWRSLCLDVCIPLKVPETGCSNWKCDYICRPG